MKHPSPRHAHTAVRGRNAAVAHPLEEVLFEFRQIGSYVRVTAIDPITATEVEYVGSTRMSQDALKHNARRRLFYVLNGRPEPPQGQSGSQQAEQTHRAARHHVNLPHDVQDTTVPKMSDGELDHAEAHHWLQSRGMKPIRAPRRHSFTPYEKPVQTSRQQAAKKKPRS